MIMYCYALIVFSIFFLFRFDTVLGLPRVPQSASVMSSSRAENLPVHLDQRFLDRVLTSIVLTDRCPKVFVTVSVS